ncbi:MAG: class I SAM-dependent methyltransferase [Anaerolineae bacterium]|nr:class I SAM-dependent methyltransferase [Anaerolineae bacterium]
MKPTTDFLTRLLSVYWFAPPVALWRAVELRTAAEETYPPPLLDLGCGDGLVARVLFDDRPVDVGMDPWMAQVRQAARSGAYRWVQQANGVQLPYPDGAFATAFSNSVLEHIPDVRPVLREVGRVLRPTDGRFIFTIPSDLFRRLLYFYQQRLASGDREGAERYAAEVDARLEHHHYYTPQEWAGLLAEGGMALEKARYYIPRPVEQLWDRENAQFGIGHRSLWSLLASPRLRRAGYQRLLARWVVRRYSRLWRPHYELDVAPGEPGGGLLIVGRREAGRQ